MERKFVVFLVRFVWLNHTRYKYKWEDEDNYQFRDDPGKWEMHTSTSGRKEGVNEKKLSILYSLYVVDLRSSTQRDSREKKWT